VAADACLLALVDADTRRIAFSETDAYPETLRDLLPTSLDPGSSPVADVVASGMSLSFDTSEELTQRYPELSDLVEELPFISRVFVPILGSGGPTGVLVASSRGVAHFDAEAVRLLEAIGRQCGQSLERATLYRDAHAATERAAALQAATLSIAVATTIEDVAAHAVSFAVELVDASIGALAMLDPDGTRLTVVHQVGATPRLLERWADVPATGLALAGEAAAAARSRWLTTDEVRETDPLAADDLEPLGIRSVVLIPLTSGGPILGYLGLARTDARPPPRERREILDTFADRVGGAIHRTRLFEAERRTRGELERALSRLSRLQAVSAAISQAVQVDEVAATALDASTDALGAAGGGVYIADGDVLRCIAARGIFTSAAAGKLDAIPTNAEMAMCAAYASGHVGWVPTYAEWSRRYPDGAALFEGVARSSIAIPFVVEDRILGVMTLVFSDEHVLDRAERRLARTIGHQAAVALERSMLHEREMARSRRTEYLQQLIAELAASSTATSVAATLTSTALDVLAAQAAAVALLEEDRVEVAAARGYPRAVVEAIAASEGGPGRSVIRTQHPAFLRTPEAIADRYPSLAEHLGPAMAELPLRVRGGVLGVLLLSFEQPRTFDLEQVDTLAAIASEAAQAIHRARVTQREREISRTLQSSLLPDEPISSWNGARVTTWYSAGTEYLDVGGDWYDAIELPDGRLAVSIGDVVGRGLRAAAAMGQLRSALRGLALELRGPGATLEALNRFAAMTPGTELATVAYGELDPISGSFTYACAGHPPPVAWIDGTVQVLEDGRSPLLAAGYDGHRGEATCSLPPGSTLVLYTDGLVERRDEPFHRGIARLQETLELAGQQELETLTETLIETLLADQDRSDDAALLCLRTGIPMSFSMTFPNEPEALRALRHQFQEWLEVGGSPVREAEALVLAVNEAAANAIEHGYREAQGNVEVTAEMRDHVVEVTVTDRGSWLDADPEPSRGRGLSLMRTLMDEVDLQAGPGGTRVVLRRQLAGDASPTPLATVGDER
jgi:serine/threonine-protein kinase RsbW